MKIQYLVEVLLPVFDNKGVRFKESDFKTVSATLTRKFGGATSFLRAPADGTWVNNRGMTHDEVIVIETMVDTLEEEWWKSFRLKLEKKFRQRAIVVRSQMIIGL